LQTSGFVIMDRTDITAAFETTLGVLPSSERILATKIYQAEQAALTSVGNGIVGVSPIAVKGHRKH
jgi:hypothetical protein